MVRVSPDPNPTLTLTLTLTFTPTLTLTLVLTRILALLYPRPSPSPSPNPNQAIDALHALAEASSVVWLVCGTASAHVPLLGALLLGRTRWRRARTLDEQPPHGPSVPASHPPCAQCTAAHALLRRHTPLSSPRATLLDHRPPSERGRLRRRLGGCPRLEAADAAASDRAGGSSARR